MLKTVMFDFLFVCLLVLLFVCPSLRCGCDWWGSFGQKSSEKETEKKNNRNTKKTKICVFCCCLKSFIFLHTSKHLNFQFLLLSPSYPYPPKSPKVRRKTNKKITANIGNHLDSPKLTDIVPTPIFPQSNFLKTVFQLWKSVMVQTDIFSKKKNRLKSKLQILRFQGCAILDRLIMKLTNLRITFRIDLAKQHHTICLQKGFDHNLLKLFFFCKTSSFKINCYGYTF